MNWVVTLTRNNLALTRAAIESFKKQDIDGGVKVLVVDNDSSDSTRAWLAGQRDIYTIMNTPQKGVASAWNQALRWVFKENEYALVANNDVVLRKDSYHYLVADGGGFVTCVGSNDPTKIEPTISVTEKGPPIIHAAPSGAKRPHPDFSCFLIRRWVYEKVGTFDEGYLGAYCEDSDYHLRMHRAGVKAECLDLPFHHIGAATINNASSKEKMRISKQADVNRALFKRTYGFEVGSADYYAAFGHTAPG